ncbi:hypothetical protein SKAU_G00283420 [Synaphobranchus kaupii]|uniref:Uncharacterized protein n=1 Tax=Synaphobranchus kaupii TaxID=118154 RepID=A0A9Q1EXJ5_SYNKA|nr:hypothetical protein SKAU_G00283420 [Synaphobranchus kaupii]
MKVDQLPWQTSTWRRAANEKASAARRRQDRCGCSGGPSHAGFDMRQTSRKQMQVCQITAGPYRSDREESERGRPGHAMPRVTRYKQGRAVGPTRQSKGTRSDKTQKAITETEASSGALTCG